MSVGRPKKRVLEPRRLYMLTVRLSLDEHELMQVVAERKGLTIAALLRLLVQDEARRLLGLGQK